MLLPKPVRPVDSEKKGKDNWILILLFKKFYNLFIFIINFQQKDVDLFRDLHPFLFITVYINYASSP